MPTKQTVPSRSRRDAATAIISSAVYARSRHSGRSRDGGTATSAVSSTCCRIHSVKRSRSRLIASHARRTRCRGRSSRARTRGAPRPARPRPRRRPARQHDRARPRSSSSTISSTVTSDRADASTASFCTPMIPQSCTLPRAVGLLRVDDADVGPERRHGGELLAGERAGRSARRAYARRGRCRRSRAAPRRGGSPPRPRMRRPCPACECSSSSSGRGQPCSTASRNRWSDPTPGLPPQEKTSLRAQPIADQLVVDQVRRHADERQVAAALADQLVPGRVRDQVREALQRDGVAVAHESGDRLAEREDLGHRAALHRREDPIGGTKVDSMLSTPCGSSAIVPPLVRNEVANLCAGFSLVKTVF